MILQHAVLSMVQKNWSVMSVLGEVLPLSSWKVNIFDFLHVEEYYKETKFCIFYVGCVKFLMLSI